MKIDNMQVPKGYTKTKASNTTEQKEDFSKLLLGEINNTKENNVKEVKNIEKVVDSEMEETEVDDAMESINTLLMFINMPLPEDNTGDIAVLGGEQLVEINNVSSIPLNLVDVDNLNVPVDLIDSVVSESFVLENVIVSEILVENKMIENEETINSGDELVQEPAILDKNMVGRVENIAKPEHIVKLEINDKNLPIVQEFNSSNEVKAISPEELSKIEDFDLNNFLDEEVLDIKKEEPIEINKWLNNNLQGTQKVNVANEIDQQPKVLSKDNMQNINDSIIQLMETTTEGNTNVMKVQLYPEELGAVNITLKMEDGKLIAKILVDDDYIKQLFTGKIEQLNNSLIKQNINMEEIFVELNSNSNPNSESGQNNSNFSNQNNAFELIEDSMEETRIEEIKLNQGELSILA